MFPVDVDFRTTNTSISVIIEKIKNGSLDYIKFGTIDARLFDLCLSHLSLDPLIVRSVPELDIRDKDDPRVHHPGWSVYRGHGLCETIETLIIEDHVIYGLETMKEYNGKRYSEIPRHIQRRIEETPISVYVDNSFYNTDNTKAVDLYCDVLNNLK